MNSAGAIEHGESVYPYLREDVWLAQHNALGVSDDA